MSKARQGQRAEAPEPHIQSTREPVHDRQNDPHDGHDMPTIHDSYDMAVQHPAWNPDSRWSR